jgi:hypothetical protein
MFLTQAIRENAAFLHGATKLAAILSLYLKTKHSKLKTNNIPARP